ncbi:MAG: hypothetical protein AB7K24_28105 [Gemmataceae bacterium]
MQILKEFELAMQGLAQIIAMAEQAYPGVQHPTEKKLLGENIALMKKGMSDARQAVPQYFQTLQQEVARVRSDADQSIAEIDKNLRAAEAQIAEHKKLEEVKARRRASYDDARGAVEPIDTGLLRTEMFAGLRLEPPFEAQLNKPVVHKDIWDESSQEWSW